MQGMGSGASRHAAVLLFSQAAWARRGVGAVPPIGACTVDRHHTSQPGIPWLGRRMTMESP